MLSRSRLRRGITLVELLVVMAILAVLAGILMPELFRRVTESRGAALATDLRTVGTAAAEFRKDVGRYPSLLTQLVAPITTADTDLCGVTYPAVFAARWRGPYLDRPLDANGIAAEAATIPNQLLRFPATVTPPDFFGVLVVLAADADSVVAAHVETTFDRTINFADGAIRWAPTTAGFGTLAYIIPIRGC